MYFPIYLFQFPASPASTRPRCLCPCRPRSILQDNGRQVFQLADSHRGWTWWCEQVWQRGPSQPRPCAKSLHYPAESTSWHSQPLRWTRNTHCHSPQSLTQAFYFFFWSRGPSLPPKWQLAFSNVCLINSCRTQKNKTQKRARQKRSNCFLWDVRLRRRAAEPWLAGRGEHAGTFTALVTWWLRCRSDGGPAEENDPFSISGPPPPPLSSSS